MKLFLLVIALLVSNTAFAEPVVVSRYPQLNSSLMGTPVVIGVNLANSNYSYNLLVKTYYADWQINQVAVSSPFDFLNGYYLSGVAVYDEGSNIGSPIIYFPKGVFVSYDVTTQQSTWNVSYSVFNVELTSLPPTILPLSDSQVTELFNSALPNTSSNTEQLEKIITRLDKIVGDPSNDVYVPEALKGKITSTQYFALMGATGLFAGFIVMQIWARAF
jgi:hypothetical protein